MLGCEDGCTIRYGGSRVRENRKEIQSRVVPTSLTAVEVSLLQGREGGSLGREGRCLVSRLGAHNSGGHGSRYGVGRGVSGIIGLGAGMILDVNDDDEREVERALR